MAIDKKDQIRILSQILGPCILVSAAWIGCQQVKSPPAANPQVALPELVNVYADVVDTIQSHYADVVARPGSANAWGIFGMVLQAHEFHQESIPCYKKACELQPNEPKWAWLLASQILQNDPDHALGLLRREFADTTDLQPFLMLQLQILQYKGDTTAAQEILAKATSIQMPNPYFQVQIARWSFEKGELAIARKQITQIWAGESICSQFADAAQLLARLEYAEGHKEDADRILKHSQSFPLSETAIVNPYLNEVASMRRDPLWLGEMAFASARQGSALATSDLERLVERFPDVVPNRIHLALLWLDQRKHLEAESVLTQGLQGSPDNERLLITLAAVQLDKLDWHRAEQTLRQILELNSTNGAAWADLGFVLEQQSRINDAIAAYESALQIYPEDNDLMNRLRSLTKVETP